MSVRFGIAGWSYDDWRGVVYPRTCADTLRFCAARASRAGDDQEALRCMSRLRDIYREAGDQPRLRLAHGIRAGAQEPGELRGDGLDPYAGGECALEAAQLFGHAVPQVARVCERLGLGQSGVNLFMTNLM